MYQIIRRENADDLTEAVNSYINQGWELVGSVAMTCVVRPYTDRDDCLCSSTDWVWAQAIKRRAVG